jgi:hypothetical protein
VIQLIAKDAGLRLNLSINAAAEVVTSYASIFELKIEQRRLRVREVRPASRGNTLGALPSNILSTCKHASNIDQGFGEHVTINQMVARPDLVRSVCSIKNFADSYRSPELRLAACRRPGS